MSSRLAVILARGGSKRLPRKNLIQFGGRPMLAWSVEAALESGCFERVLVSTDDAEIAAVGRQAGADVPFLRNAAMDDQASSSAATLVALCQAEEHWGKSYGVVAQLMANCPLRTAKDLQGAVSAFDAGVAPAQISAFQFGWMNPWWAARLGSDRQPDWLFPEFSICPFSRLATAVLPQRSSLDGKTRFARAWRWLLSAWTFVLSHELGFLARHRRRGRSCHGQGLPRIASARGVADVKITIRTDESPEIGTGHLARCQALADMLRQCGAVVSFVCRHISYQAERRLREAGHLVIRIPGSGEIDELPHASWLGGSQAFDADATKSALNGTLQDWLIVDHYALDNRWEHALRDAVSRIMVIDDLADRKHDCDILLDQNLHESPAGRYDGLLPTAANLLLGPRYALLRTEFANLPRRVRAGQVGRLLVFFGGVDKANQTGRTLTVLPSVLPNGTDVDVVIGDLHPCRDRIVERCLELGYRCHVQTPRMAELMTAADVSIGGGGTAIWERCCSGLPALVWQQADNQIEQLKAAARVGLLHAPDKVDRDDEALKREIRDFCQSPTSLHKMSLAGLERVDGQGTARVCSLLGCSCVTVRQTLLTDADKALGFSDGRTPVAEPEVGSPNGNSYAPRKECNLRAWRQLLFGFPARW